MRLLYDPPIRNEGNKNYLQAKRILGDIANKDHLLAFELGKLPELQDDISSKEVRALENILKLYEIDPIIFNSAFDKMYK